MMKNVKTTKEQITELMTGITIEQWEENNKKLEALMKEQEERKRKQMQEANDQISMSMGYL